MKLFAWISFGLTWNLHMNNHKQAILQRFGKWASQLCCMEARSICDEEVFYRHRSKTGIFIVVNTLY